MNIVLYIQKCKYLIINIKNLVDILARINKIELNQDVNDIVYRDVLLWPLIRSYLSKIELAGNISTKKDSTFKRLLIGILDSTTLFNFHKLFNKNGFKRDHFYS